MKKILLLIICTMLLTGCGTGEKVDENAKLNMNEVKENLSKLTVEGNSPYADLESVNDLDLIEGYGIDVTLLEDYVIYISSSVEDPSMYMVLKPADGKASVVKYQAEDMFEQYLSAYMGYYPEAATIIENKMEKEYNDYLIYIVSNDNEKVYKKILDCKE